MRELRLRTSLILLLVTASTLTFALVGSAILVFRLPQIEASIRADLQERAENASRLLDHYTDGIEAQVRTQARLVAGRSPAELQAFLDAMVGEGETLQAAYIVGADGSVEALGLPGTRRQAAAEMRGADFSNSPLFQSARAVAVKGSAAPAIWSDKYLSAISGKHAVGIAVPAGNKVVIGEVALERVLLMFRSLEPGSESTVVVIDHQGQWLASSRANPAGRFTNFSTFSTFQAIVAGRPLPEYDVLEGQRMLVGGVVARNLHWVIAAAAPAGTASPIYFTTIVLVAGGFAGSLLLSMALAPLWAARMVRPLNALIERTHRVIDGDYSSPWPRRGAISELNQLSRDLGDMVEVIQAREAGMARSEERLRATLENTPSLAVQWFDADGRVLYWNKASELMYGFTAAEAVGALIGENHLMYPDREQAEDFIGVLKEIDRGGQPFGPAEFPLRKKGGTEIVVLATSFAIPGERDSKIFVRMDVDVTQRKKAEERVQELAFFDQLTGLPNRTLMLDRLRQAMAASARTGGHGALLFIDLDNFKTLNDTLGHDTGDLLLQQVGRRLVSCMRQGDTVARLGGDEFVVMLEDLSANSQEAVTQAEVVGEKILVTLNQTYEFGIHVHHSTPSIGVTLFVNHLETTDELLKRADLAMYQAKAAGRNTLRFYDPDMQATVTARAALELDLRKAIAEQQFLLYYQPQVDSSGRVIGAEALVRWQHPQRGLVSPAEFIPLAEESGLILPLGQWVLETACARLLSWASRPEMARLTLAVNVSARQFSLPNFVGQVLDVIERGGIRPEMLKLELTESLLLENVEDIIAKMSALKARGVGFSMDDFGTGFSSLSYLKRLPLDQLKIDQAFVREVHSSPSDGAIARTIVALGQNLGLTVIAEGVETAVQRDYLASIGCHAYQGYFFSRPLPLEGFDAFVLRT